MVWYLWILVEYIYNYPPVIFVQLYIVYYIYKNHTYPVYSYQIRATDATLAGGGPNDFTTKNWQLSDSKNY